MIDLRSRVHTTVTHLLVATVLLVVGGIFVGLVVMITGLVPIKASSGHWAITAALLDFAKKRSVSTYSFRVKPPPLDDQALVLKGAGHYDFACEPCHGSPVLQQPRIARAMTPTPPDVRTAALEFDPAELFYIVKHGIKFTGMPAWPAQRRDDEVWAMVAFLQRLPTLEPAGYDDLTGVSRAAPGDKLPLEDLLGPSPPAPKAIGENCARCHGADGLGRGTGAFPRLAGQRLEYLSGTLTAYARGERHSGIMQPVAASLGEQDIHGIAEYYSRLPGVSTPARAADARHIEQGRRIASEGVPERLVPACRECHGPGLPRNPNYPRLAGQYQDYLKLQLSLFRNRSRGGTPYHELMHKVAGQLTDEHIDAVTAFYASLAADR